MQFDDVRMVELGQKCKFAVGALSIGGILEGVEYFFEGKGLSCTSV